MAYIVDPINNTLIDDEKPFTKIADNLGKKKEYKQLEFDFSEKKKDAQRPYDHFGGGIAPRSLLCVRKRRFPFLKKDIMMSVIWSVICLRNLLLKLRTLRPHFHMRRGSPQIIE